MRTTIVLRACLAALAPAIVCAPITPAAAQKGSPSYTFADLGPGQAYGVNAAGLIVGESRNVPQPPTTGGNYASRPVLWSRSASGAWTATDLLLNFRDTGAFFQGRAAGINSQGEIVGSWGQAGGPGQAFIIRPALVNGIKTWYQDRGDGFNALMTTTNYAGVSINDYSQIVSDQFAMQFLGGVETDTPLPGDGATAINTLRQVAGSINGPASQLANVWQLDAGGNVVGSRTYNPVTGYGWSAATAIDNSGNIVGYSGKLVKPQNPAYGWRANATLWQNGSPIALGATGEFTWANGVSMVNGALQVVGLGDSTQGQFAFRWTAGKMSNLNTMATLPKGATGISAILINANAINANGLIVGYVHIPEGPVIQDLYDAYVLTPK
jgi:hypothetical protein